MTRLKIWWDKLTGNEKLMFVLIVILLVGIATRWRFVLRELVDSLRAIFMR